MKKRNYIYIDDCIKTLNSSEFIRAHDGIETIYIDPPYNTKTRKSYNDNRNADEWEALMYNSIKLSSNVLKDGGSLFISIDDNSLIELRDICDDIFGKSGFVGVFITYQSQRSNANHINTVHEYVVCYTNNKAKLPKFNIKRMYIERDRVAINKAVRLSENIKCDSEFYKAIVALSEEDGLTWIKNYNKRDENNCIFYATDLSTPSSPREVHIDEIGLHLPELKSRGWVSDDMFVELHNNNMLHFVNGRPYKKNYLVDSVDNVQSVLNYYSRSGTKELSQIGLAGCFDTPKPKDLIKYLILISTSLNGTVLDFFAGSGTTAHAVNEINSECGYNISYVLIQKPESFHRNSSFFKKCLKVGIDPTVQGVLMERTKRVTEINNGEHPIVIHKTLAI